MGLRVYIMKVGSLIREEALTMVAIETGFLPNWSRDGQRR
jgi:hypothetical protein